MRFGHEPSVPDVDAMVREAREDREEIKTLGARVAELEAALTKYGHHRGDCASRRFVDESACAERHPCDCGLDAALRGTR